MVAARRAHEVPPLRRQNHVLRSNTITNARPQMRKFLVLFCLGVLVFFHSRSILTTTTIQMLQNDTSNSNAKRDGLIVLGMHRSGTSMLTGLLSVAAGYTYGSENRKDVQNAKGYFERLDALNQNQQWLKNQNITWNNENILKFDTEQALRDIRSGNTSFDNGKSFLEFAENPENIPWLQKDPRMCITLQVWLQRLEKEPAIVFTYRHPLEVALSLFKREKSRKRNRKPLSLAWCLKLWIAYNMRAIQNAKGLCIVRTSNNDILSDPFKELQRIRNELTSKCGVPSPLHEIFQHEIDKFVDPTLQHSQNSTREVLESFHAGCVAYRFESDTQKGTPEYKEEIETYLEAMRIYCDLESGKAYREDYEWPELRF